MTTNSTPLVSVITPFLNEERFLGEAIESVLQQAFQDWELILVDDGSSDGSTAIAKDYALRFPDRIFYHNHPQHANKGLSASRNTGISHARGELIVLLDADDAWLPQKLSRQIAVFQRNPGIAMVAEASLYWYSWSSAARKDVAMPIGAPQDSCHLPGELTSYLYPLGTGAAPCPSGLMITKKALTRLGGFEESFTKELQLYEDQAFLHKVYLLERVYISSDCNNKYRQRTGSIVQQVNSAGHYHRVRRYFLEWLQGYLRDMRIEGSKTGRLVEQALIPYRYPRLHFMAVTIPEKMKGVIRKGLRKLIR